MARTLDTLPTRKGGHRTAKYPYAEWFDGTVRVILKDEDYSAKTLSMKSSLAGEASNRGFALNTRSLDSLDPASGKSIRQLLKLNTKAEGFAFQAIPKPAKNGSE
jgi:hypothetical protein